MKKLIGLVGLLVSVNAHAVLYYCEGNNQDVALQPYRDNSCRSKLAVEHRSREYCVSRLSEALDGLRAGTLYNTCTEFAKDGTGKWVARVNYAIEFGAESALAE